MIPADDFSSERKYFGVRFTPVKGLTQMSLAFSTEPLPARCRREAWLWKAKELCGDCRFEFPKRAPFHGSIDVSLVGGLELMKFSSSPLSFTESLSESAQSMAWVITQVEGVRSYSQDGVRVVLEPGDSTLVDARRPWSSHSPEESVRLYLRVPRRPLENRLRTTELPVAQRISGRTGVGAVLFRLATSLYNEAGTFSAEEGAYALQAYFEMLSACIAHLDLGSRAERSRHDLPRRLHSFIESHLREPDLNPEEIAAAFGISVRHLHRLFSSEGQTISQWIRDRRLEHCRTDLADPSYLERTITDIAFFWGFSDSAHFSHLFRKKFGTSARAFRSNAERTASATDTAVEKGSHLGRASFDLQYKPN